MIKASIVHGEFDVNTRGTLSEILSELTLLNIKIIKEVSQMTDLPTEVVTKIVNKSINKFALEEK